MARRGTFNFLVSGSGDLLDDAENIRLLRQMWLDRNLIDGIDLGPGRDSGDFVYGAWHSSCHLVAGKCVRQTLDGRLLLLEISHEGARDLYYASVSVRGPGGIEHYRLDTNNGRALIENSKLLGYIEGASRGRITARGVNDTPDLFNGWRRQDYDQPPNMENRDGGPVWEHWCTTRDIRASCGVGSSVISAYISLTSAAGDLFPATVARGRTSYHHPDQLNAMITAGFTTLQSASWDTRPISIPNAQKLLLYEATYTAALQAIEQLAWDVAKPRYYMFSRRINSWDPRR
jgi:hypothetical protein